MNFQTWRARWWAFSQMGMASFRLKEVAGLRFARMLGSGGGNNFSVWPNFSTYALLAVWESEKAAHAFFHQHEFFKEFQLQTQAYWTTYMKTAMVHGKWEGACPFQPSSSMNEQEPVAVLTRATIYPRHLYQFWRNVPKVSRSANQQEGLLFSIGVGELPLIQQATFSLWQSSELMKAYAYKSHYHREVIQRTRALGWYKEELFARFSPYAFDESAKGVYPGSRKQSAV